MRYIGHVVAARPQPIAPVIVAIVLAVGSGTAIGMTNLPPIAVAVLLAGGVGAGGLLLVRQLVVVPHVGGRPRTAVDALRPRDTADPLQYARRLFFVGILLIGGTVLRVAGFTLADWCFLAAMLVALAQAVAFRGQPMLPPLPRAFLLGGLLFALGGLISSAAARSPGESVVVIIRTAVILFGWIWLCLIVVRSFRDVRTAVSLWVLSAAAIGGTAIVQLLWGDVIPLPGDTIVDRARSIGLGRMLGMTQHPNDLGAICAIAFVPALALAVQGGTFPRWPPARIMLMLAIAAGLVLSGSVGAMLAAVAGVAVWLAIARLGPASCRSYSPAGWG